MSAARTNQFSEFAATGTATTDHCEGPQLAPLLSNRHIQMIAIGGAIGTGPFRGSGKTISGWASRPVRLHDNRLHRDLRHAALALAWFVNGQTPL